MFEPEGKAVRSGTQMCRSPPHGLRNRERFIVVGIVSQNTRLGCKLTSQVLEEHPDAR